MKALAVLFVYSLKLQKGLEALKWDQKVVYKSYAGGLCVSLFQRLISSLVDVFLLGQLVFLWFDSSSKVSFPLIQVYNKVTLKQEKTNKPIHLNAVRIGGRLY